MLQDRLVSGLVGLLLLSSPLPAAAAQTDCISGEISAEFQTDGPFAGLYKYTVRVEWKTEKGLSHITLDCGFQACPEAACALDWFFDAPAGIGRGGEPDGDDLDWDGDAEEAPPGEAGKGSRSRSDDGYEDDDEGTCEFTFSGEFNCQGDPSIGHEGPVLKWDVADRDGCEAGKEGTAVLCFYSGVPPAQGELPVVLAKNGRNVCSGTLTGPCPLVCPVNVETTRWGRIKALFED